MGDGFDREILGEERIDGVEIAGVGFEKGFADGGFVIGGEWVAGAHAVVVEEDFAGKRVAVGVEAIAGEANEAVTGDNGGIGELVGFIDDADDAADDIDFAIVVDAGHLGGFSADEGASNGFTGFGGTGDDAVENGSFELTASEVIEEEEGFCALAQDVVDAMVDDVVAEAGIVAGELGDFGFGADSVD